MVLAQRRHTDQWSRIESSEIPMCLWPVNPQEGLYGGEIVSSASGAGKAGQATCKNTPSYHIQKYTQNDLQA